MTRIIAVLLACSAARLGLAENLKGLRRSQGRATDSLSSVQYPLDELALLKEVDKAQDKELHEMMDRTAVALGQIAAQRTRQQHRQQIQPLLLRREADEPMTPAEKVMESPYFWPGLLGDSFGLVALAMGITIGVWAVLVTITAFLYIDTKAHPPQQKRGIHTVVTGRWQHHLFQCLHEPGMCLFSFFCLPIRWADTMRMAGFFDFWAAFLLMLCLTGLSYLPVPLSGLPFLVVAVYYRQLLRAMFSIPSCTCQTVIGDCCAYCFCGVCAVLQEARHLEEAYQSRHPALHLGLLQA
mmetsp:Transcript_45134/g.98104  ORF Transcript_45134/g.98104 Transcript_45134/m.98104 type:complete len:296 (-) Transcript_45134:67-954(-)|eukprot:CAMPEP_0170621152 /NCGR_PEP_ID=MMETSP0224-20130122/28452_1 /TAXON_ID=285029 /ORGANISM="Togula jolla, Strain CCCM 725" /LENGTH=295 /DNA_ID=CAMNT_0010947399 /DNA_START=16 /DNA_END=903 /DNA_ORIENTATION=-